MMTLPVQGTVYKNNIQESLALYQTVTANPITIDANLAELSLRVNSKIQKNFSLPHLVVLHLLL